ncbi:putative sterigmatocystin biosynthesis monooxygenase stcW [Termitomyces sp. T112]|nr:putative sterigmatocystin biosynthesis monooxygenase stcW [Termitomyces sp. T112]
MKIICIGAGASGLLLAYKLQRSFNNFELVLYEKNEDISGTWFENRYPGCACDIPAHTYTWSFEPKHDWSAVYASSDEIRNYFESFATKYALHKYVKLQHRVDNATWNSQTDSWDVEITDLARPEGKSDNSQAPREKVIDHANILVNASGVLNAWKWPDIAGLHDFKGLLLHTADWDRSVNLEGKRVGLIGNGSSGIQVLPAIQPKVAKLTTFVRRPTWVFPTQGFEQHVYSEKERELFRTDPAAHLAYRKRQENATNNIFSMFLVDSDQQKTLFAQLVQAMNDKLGGVETPLAEKLVPKYGVGCRRITPGVGYLEGLSKENVEVVYGNIERITERGCISSDGMEREFDVLICATGFDTSYMPRFSVKGVKGRSMREEWSKEAKAYLGMGVAGFPNYFLVIGPNSPIGNGPVLSSVEAQIDYILKFANRWQTENIRSFSPKPEAVEDFIAHKDAFMKKTVWEHDCKSWYKANSVSGKVSALWPGSTLHYLEAIADPRYDDWEITYKGNRFAWLGNGYSQTEVDKTADLSYYIRNEDDSPLLGRRKALQVVNKSGTVFEREARSFLR